MIVRFNGLTEATRLDGIWRYPAEEADVSEAQGNAYVARGLTEHHAAQSPSPVVEQPRTAVPQLFLNGRPVQRFPERRGVVVSVVVPLFRSAKFLPGLLQSLRGSDPTPYELILVSDGDGQPDVAGKLVVLPENRGFAVAVNVGARYAAGGLLCLLNADAEVRPNWLAPMVKLIGSAPDVAAVGNRNLDDRGRIDSVGSEFSYRTGNFEHVLLNEPDTPGPERDTVDERDMITAACLLVRRTAWGELGGLDEAYRRAYFEDSDFCMRLRAAGCRILYCPHSVITHYKNHSSAGRHSSYGQNKRLFHQRWVETGLVDKFARQRGRRVHGGDVVACYIVLNEEEYIQASLESVYPLADRIVIVEGGNDYAIAAGLCGPDKRSTDATVERIKSFPDPRNKIELIQGAWRNKAEQRQAYAKRLKPDDWMLLMDGDEVFFEAGLWRLSALMHRHEIIMPGFTLFWNNFETVGTGLWDQFPQVKVVRWHEGYHYRDHNCPCDATGRLVSGGKEKRRLIAERLYAHYAWVKPLDKLRKKAAYYERQPGAASRIRPRYIDDVFLPWRETPLAIAERFGTHPFGGGGFCAFEGEHPEPIRKRLEAGELSWNR